MTVEAEQTTSDPGHRDEVSGVVVHVLINLVHDLKGDVGVAQALALAGDSRSFAALADMGAWSSLEEAVALFNAAALVTGDGAVGSPCRGEAALRRPTAPAWSTASGPWVRRPPRSSTSNPWSGHFDATSEAVALEVATDHALIQVLPLSGEGRHAHLCEMTRGLLSQVPALYGRGPALISETECSARGGRYCLYALSWEEPSTGCGRPRRRRRPRIRAHPGPSTSDPMGRGWTGPRGPKHREVTDRTAELRAELNRMSVLIEGAFAMTSQLMSDDIESLLSQIAARADAVVAAHRYLLMVRVRPGMPMQLHSPRPRARRGPDRLAAELWRDDPDDDGGSRLIVDIASPDQLYGRLVEFLPRGRGTRRRRPKCSGCSPSTPPWPSTSSGC